ncbi:hypothetical protein [Clostridium saccharoperbutylacetonicum]|uniref:hypothetical protein n=1 Tax=Clostridium saccharoperbutylacetonicum TaxID=36745 RepID=UPI0039EC56B8
MKGKSSAALILAAFVVASLSLTGCGNTSRNRTRYNNNSNNAQDDINNTRSYSQNAADATRNSADTARNATDNAVNAANYTAQNFRNDISNAGYTVTDWANNKNNYFKGKETNYKLGGDAVRLYEYNSASDLEGDINRIAPNGMTINGTDAKFANSPYYYRKGNTLIMYEGKEPTYVDEFNRVYGNPLRP